MPTDKPDTELTVEQIQKPRPYEKLRRAYEENRGTNLTAKDVIKLMRDTAIYDAVMETYADEPEY